MSTFTLEALASIISERAAESPDVSYTAALLSRGTAKCARKFGEEALEAIVAALDEEPAALKAEAADVLYHLLVLLRSRGVALSEVLAELEARTGRSGIEEKASRGQG